MDNLVWPSCGDVVMFRAPVFVPTWDGVQPSKAGQFLWWISCAGDAVAVVQTSHGDAHVRWSMIDGITGPEGLLER